MSVRIKEVAFIFHPFTEPARMRNFYERLLGLNIGFELEFAPGKWWIEYDIGGVALALSNAFADPQATFKPAASLTLEVFDLDAALADLRTAGVPISQEVMEFAPCRMFSAKDPDGNEIRFHRRKSAA